MPLSGIIMLIGIVKKNAIMMIDFALEAQRTEGKGPLEAIYEGCLIRFRPIMMTTMAALMGTLPIALGFGAGAEARRPSGPGRGRRPGLLPVSDPLHHPGFLHLHGVLSEKVGRVPRATVAARSEPSSSPQRAYLLQLVTSHLSSPLE